MSFSKGVHVINSRGRKIKVALMQGTVWIGTEAYRSIGLSFDEASALRDILNHHYTPAANPSGAQRDASGEQRGVNGSSRR